jgi:hypothetical protein
VHSIVRLEWHVLAICSPPPSTPVGYLRRTSYFENKGSQSLNLQVSVLLIRPCLAMSCFGIDYVTKTNTEPSWDNLLSCAIELWVIGSKSQYVLVSRYAKSLTSKATWKWRPQLSRDRHWAKTCRNGAQSLLNSSQSQSSIVSTSSVSVVKWLVRASTLMLILQRCTDSADLLLRLRFP